MTNISIAHTPSITTLSGSSRVVTVTIREMIIAAFEAAMTIIKTANGYHTDAGDNVFRCRRHLDPTELPCVVLWPQMEIAEARQYEGPTCTMRMIIESHAQFGAENASVVSERLLGDLSQAVFSQETISPMIDFMGYESGGTDTYPDTGETTVAAKLNLLIRYNYQWGNPYAKI